MPGFVLFIITLAVAWLGSFTARKLKIPAGAMIGSMAAVIIFNVITDKGMFYSDFKLVLQVFSGAMIGGKVAKEDVIELKRIIFPAIILVVCMVILNIVFGTLIYICSDLDIATSLFATTPGGVSDMALISEELGANTGYVAILQVFRLLIIYTFCPPIFKYVMKKGIGQSNKTAVQTTVAGAETVLTDNTISKDNQILEAENIKLKFEPVRFACLLIASGIVGIIFNSLGVTAGMIIGGMVGAAVWTIATRKTLFPNKVRIGLQTCSGAFIGMRMTRESLMSIGELFVPILIMTIGILVFVFATSFIIHKLTKLEYATCMFASTPGGLQEMALLADDMGADALKVSVMQTCRLVFVISFFPTMIRAIYSIVTSLGF